MVTRLRSSWIWIGAIAATLTANSLNSPAIAATPTDGLPIVRSTVLQPDLSVPWSQPVRIIDPFEGESLAVFDQNYFTRSFRNTKSQVEVVSLWKPRSVSVLLAYSGRECSIGARRNFGIFAQHSFRSRHRSFGLGLGYSPFNDFHDDFHDDFSSSVCVANNGIQKITKLSIKVKDLVFQIENKNGQFPISSELATALKTAPEQNAQLRAIADNGEIIDSAIGLGTVKAWRSIY